MLVKLMRRTELDVTLSLLKKICLEGSGHYAPTTVTSEYSLLLALLFFKPDRSLSVSLSIFSFISALYHALSPRLHSVFFQVVAFLFP